MTRAELENFCLQLPKIELHVHLEGSMQPATLLRLARRRGVDLPANDEASLTEWFRFRDFDHFVDIYLTCSKCLRDPEDFQVLIEVFLREQARQNVLYSEVHFTIGTHLGNGVNGGEVAEAIWEAIQDGERRFGSTMRLIPDIVRNVGRGPADQTLEWALAGRERGVVALGLSGSETFPDEPFRELFQVARSEGLHRVAHAGEHLGPESIRSVIDVCDPERIGHGVAAAQDEALMETLASNRMPLEVCPSSNVALGVFSSIDDHPFDRLRRAGIEVSVNSDDPPFFDTTLSDEYVRVAQCFGYSSDDLVELALQPLRHAFLDSPARERLAREIDSRITAMQVE
jgi:aminodeoxyfutalosine deaminase